MVHNQRLKIARVSLLGLSFGTASALTIAAAPACSSGFASCIESHTCPADEDAAGAGGAPEPRSPTEGGAGNAGAPVGGGEAVAGDGAGIAALAVVRTTPEDAAVDVERDQVIEVEFSSELDADSVTESTFEVTGPSGRVEGDLSVDGATITFTPSAPLPLLADHTVTLGEGLAASSGDVLEVAESFDFRVRDGILRKAERLHAKEVFNLAVTGSPSGHAAVTWTHEDAGYALIFEPGAGQWGKVQSIGDWRVRVCFNSHGEALAIAGSEAGVWSRWSSGTWSKSQSGITGSRACALHDDGTALTLWTDSSDNDWEVLGSSLSSADVWSATSTVQASAGLRGLLNYGTGYLAFYDTADPDYTMREVYSRVFENGKWAPAKPVTSTNAGAQYTSNDARGVSAIFAWQDAKMRMHAATYDGSTWEAKELGPAFGENSSKVTPNGYITGWSYEGTAYVASYQQSSGWADPVKLGAVVPEEVGPGVAVDAAGNALAAWPSGSSVIWRRFSHASGEWEPAQEIIDQDSTYVYVQGSDSGDAVLVWANDLGVWASRFE